MKKILSILVIVSILATTGCNPLIKVPFGSPKLLPTETFIVDEATPDGTIITAVFLTLAPSNGSLILAGDAERMGIGTIQYNVANWKPTLEVEDTALRIEQKVPDALVASTPKGSLNQWNLKLDNSLSNINVSCPAGDYNLTFVGTLPDGASISVNAGAGNLRLVFPTGVRVNVEIHHGLANITTEGTWTTSSKTYSSGNSGPVWMVKVDIGVGNVTLVVE